MGIRADRRQRWRWHSRRRHDSPGYSRPDDRFARREHHYRTRREHRTRRHSGYCRQYPDHHPRHAVHDHANDRRRRRASGHDAQRHSGHRVGHDSRTNSGHEHYRDTRHFAGRRHVDYDWRLQYCDERRQRTGRGNVSMSDWHDCAIGDIEHRGGLRPEYHHRDRANAERAATGCRDAGALPGGNDRRTAGAGDEQYQHQLRPEHGHDNDRADHYNSAERPINASSRHYDSATDSLIHHHHPPGPQGPGFLCVKT
jgi:hypothetical protein